MSHSCFKVIVGSFLLYRKTLGNDEGFRKKVILNLLGYCFGIKRENSRLNYLHTIAIINQGFVFTPFVTVVLEEKVNYYFHLLVIVIEMFYIDCSVIGVVL